MDPPQTDCEPSALLASTLSPNLTQALVHSSQSKKGQATLIWIPIYDSVLRQDWPVLILLMAFLGWALTNVLFLGFTAFEIVLMKSLALGMAGVGVIWLGVNGWRFLNRSKSPKN